jgi:alpha-tubulin suppressor-like RCC1 family protein
MIRRTTVRRLPPLLVGVAMVTAVLLLSPAIAGAGGAPLGPVANVDAGSRHSCAVTNSRNVVCWGNDAQGQLGNGADGGSSSAVLVRNLADTGALTAADQVSAGARTTCAVLTLGRVACWGDGAAGQLGQGDHESSQIPVLVLNQQGNAPIRGVRSVSVGTTHVCGVTSNQVVCWGSNANGRAGLGQVAERTLPTAVYNRSGVPLRSQVFVTAGTSHTCSGNEAGVSCWGRNDFGQVGDGTRVDRRRAVHVLDGLGPSPVPRYVIPAVGSQHTCAVIQGGGVKCWGRNDAGQLGIGQPGVAFRSTPTTVRAGNAWGTPLDLAAGDRTTCAFLLSREVRCWGSDANGQLGNGSAPGGGRVVAVASATGPHDPPTGSPRLRGVTAFGGGGATFCVVLDSDDRARCWGSNRYGQVGAGTATPTSPRPTSVLAANL